MCSANVNVLSFDEPSLVASIATDIEIIYCESGTRAFYDARAGVITASMFSECRRVIGGLTDQQRQYVDACLAGTPRAEAAAAAGYKAAPTGAKIDRALRGERVGEYSTAAQDYAFRLAIERIAGRSLTDERYETYAMRRGHEMEPEARALHAYNTGLSMKRAGMVRTKDRRFGATADSLILASDNRGKIRSDGGGEYKAFTSPEKLRRILIEGDISPELDQIYGGMWLTGYSWWHFGLYCDHLVPVERELTIIEVERDDDYIEALEADLVAFDRYVERCRSQILEREGVIRVPMASAAMH